MNCVRAGLVAVAATLAAAQTPILSLTATTDHVSGANDSIRIDVLRWSTDAERDQLLARSRSPRLGGAEAYHRDPLV